MNDRIHATQKHKDPIADDTYANLQGVIIRHYIGRRLLANVGSGTELT